MSENTYQAVTLRARTLAQQDQALDRLAALSRRVLVEVELLHAIHDPVMELGGHAVPPSVYESVHQSVERFLDHLDGQTR